MANAFAFVRLVLRGTSQSTLHFKFSFQVFLKSWLRLGDSRWTKTWKMLYRPDARRCFRSLKSIGDLISQITEKQNV